ncbi:MAG TPA: serine/threonine protein phosphatase [Amycolatopsis sp.]|uniref:serine/threonine protein phosphatase n=1 Tax=Amycolatopsis sp. TaxID=37632 RepID=UPI002B47B176|nr:serine/threonine protein phosphatase [Amycolatopsis sp.]HKS44284.1 serine/threonine protein phosphatase [Amycolatopsis sp.]
MRNSAETSPGGSAAAWYGSHADVLGIGVWTESRAGQGEDAEPLLAHHVPTGTGIVGVFDGLGGSGAALEYRSGNGTPRSGAWTGSRVAKIAVESWFRATLDGTPGNTPSLDEHIAATFTLKRPVTRSKLVGTMRMNLPTTMAAIRYERSGDQVECTALWAGDSRAYTLQPWGGMHALTRDHTVETDALEQLNQDPPMTNVLCAGKEFVLDSHTVRVTLPAVLVCATDGFFGYVDTPAHFEFHLLDTLARAWDGRDWARRLAERVVSYTGDDASLSLVGFGYRSLDQLRDSFAPRTRDVTTSYPWPVPPDVNADDGLRRQWCALAWHKYQPEYERLMPALPEEPVR